MPRRKGTPKTGGRQKGSKNLATLSKEQAREALRLIVMEEMRELVAAQMANAKGIKYLVARHKSSGKFERITETELKAILKGQNSDRFVIEVWEKDPSVQAFTDLMNRALDKPAEAQEVRHTGAIRMIHEMPA